MYLPKDGGFEQRIRESFTRQGFMNLLHAKIVKTEPGYCEIHIPYNSSITQQHGFFHAGAVSSAADTSAGYAAYSLMDKTSSILTVEFKINLISPADGDLLIAESNVLKYGKTLTVCRSDVFIMKNDVRKLCAISQSTLIELKDKNDNKLV